MIFADKLIELRKKSGWSQEELAEQLGVSRQSVSKWEGAQSIPDMNKLIKMSELFSVTLDTLIKDELPLEEEIPMEVPAAENVRSVSMEEAGAFLKVKLLTAPQVALGVMLCILSPIVMFLLGGYSEMPGAAITEDMAGGIGMIVTVLIAAGAVALFLLSGSKTSRYAYLDKEVIETAYGVSGMVREEKEKYRDTYNRCNVIGVLLCICSAIPLLAMAMVDPENELLDAAMFCGTLVTVSIGVYLFVRVGIRWAAYQKLLQEGDYSLKKKNGSRIPGMVASIYWVLAPAIFLLVCGLNHRWEYSGMFWSTAGIVFVPVIVITNLLCEKKQ